VRIVDELPFGFGWLDESSFIRRCSHALAVDGRVWIFDAVADEDALERVAGLGEPAGVVQLLNRHDRDNAAIAARLGVPLHVLPEEAPEGAPFAVVLLVRNRLWHEVAALLRLTPPRKLLALEPRHLLVGHGEGVHEEVPAAMRDAVEHSRSRIGSWLWTGIRAHGPGGTHPVRRR
jgi:hypothetical protein